MNVTNKHAGMTKRNATSPKAGSWRRAVLPGTLAIGALALASVLAQPAPDPVIVVGQSQSASTPAGQPVSLPVSLPSMPATQAATQPLIDPTTQPGAGGLTLGITEPTSAPASEPASQSATQSASQPTSGPVVIWPTSQPESRPSLALSPDGKLLMNFREASLRSVLEYLSEAAGLMVIEEAKLDGRITVMSRQPVTLDEAIALIHTVLKTKGLAAVRTGRVLRIVTVEQAKKDLIPVRMGADPNQIAPTDEIVTQVIPIRYADAGKLKADLASLIPTTADVTSNASSNTLIITSTTATVRRVAEIIRAIDVHMSEVSQVKVFQLKYANAANAAKLITEIFKDDSATGGNQQGMGFPFGSRRGFMMGAMMGGMPGGPGGGGGGGSSSNDQRKAPKVTTSSDDRTNTLVVSAPPDIMGVIEGLIKELDSNPAEEQSVMVYRLKNAQAANLQTILNNVFTGSVPTGTSSSTSSNRNSTINTSGFGTSFGSSGSSGRGGMSSGGLSGFGSSGFGSSSSGFGSSSFGGRSSGTGGFGGGSGFGGSGFGRSSSGNAGNTSDLIGQVTVVADTDTNSLLVTTSSKNFERVRSIIADLDRAVPQVLIKVLLAEVSHDNSLDLGVELSAFNLRANGNGTDISSNFAGKVNTTAGGFSFTMNEQNVTAAIKAIANKSTLDVLSRPYILTSDNQQASIMVGQEVPIITNSQITDQGAVINTVQYNSVGIIVTVTPHINPDGIVTLDVAPQISSLTSQTVPLTSTTGPGAPVFDMRSASSRVAIRDGQTIVIGGLMQDQNTTSVDKVPILGDIPIIGLLFQHNVTKKTKTELLIFLTPHVAKHPDEMQSKTEDEIAGAKITPNAVEPGAFQEQMRGMQRGAATHPSTQPVITGLNSDPVTSYSLKVPMNTKTVSQPASAPAAFGTTPPQPAAPALYRKD